MQIIILRKIWHHQENLVSAAKVQLLLVSEPGVKIQTKSLLNLIQNILEELTVFQFMPTLYLDHENFGKSTIIFIQTFIKTLVILRVNKHFWGKFCVSVLFNNCFPFSIKIPVKYNTFLLVVNKVAKIPWFHNHFKRCFLKNQHC